MPASSLRIWSSRLAIVVESRERPFSAPRMSSGVSWNVVASVSRLVASWVVSSWSSVPDRPSKAATTSSGDAVRASGIVVAGSSGAPPCGSSARYFAPSSVRIWMDALVWSPTQASLTLNATRTWSPSSVTDPTRPASTPAIVTMSPACRPAASVKSAW